MKNLLFALVSALFVIAGCESVPSVVKTEPTCSHDEVQDGAILRNLWESAPALNALSSMLLKPGEVDAAQAQINDLRDWAQSLPDKCAGFSYGKWLDHYQLRLAVCRAEKNCELTDEQRSNREVLVEALRKVTPAPPRFTGEKGE